MQFQRWNNVNGHIRVVELFNGIKCDVWLRDGLCIKRTVVPVVTNAYEWTSLKAEALVCLRAQVIDDNDGVIGRVKPFRGLRDNDRGVGRRRGIHDASEVSETTAEAEGARRQARGIYDKDRGVGGGRWARRLKQQQWRRRWRIDDAYKESETMTEAEADWRQARWIGNNNGVLVFIAIAFLIVTLSCLCLVAVSFWYCFHQIPFFPSLQKILSNCNRAENILLPSVH